jgi:DNA-directed RNA polymerase subunit beta
LGYGKREVTYDDEAFRAAEELGINISARFESSNIDEI